jgi:secreted trypsin-like serine protease
VPRLGHRLLVTTCIAFGVLAAPAQAIVGGHPANDSDWPAAVALVRTDSGPRPVCGGTLVAKTVVLTAAHCLDAGGAISVRTVSHELIDVTGADVHPDADANDVALLYLSRGAEEAPASLAGADDWAGSATTTGWGDTYAGSGEGSASLLSADLPLLRDSVCADTYGAGYDPATMLCAGQGGSDSCQGDSGGPLMVRDSAGGWRLLGVTSFGGDECGADGAPSGYAWAAGPALRDWILERLVDATRGGTTPGAAAPAQMSARVAKGTRPPRRARHVRRITSQTAHNHRRGRRKGQD